VQRNVALILQKKQVKCNVFIRCFCMDCNILYRRMVRSCTLEGREIFGMCYVLQDVVAMSPSAVELWNIADRAPAVGVRMEGWRWRVVERVWQVRVVGVLRAKS